MVDWGKELGIDKDLLAIEHFWHPVAQYENDLIRQRGEDYWAYYRHKNQEPPSRMARAYSKARPRFDFTERQLELAIQSLRKDDNDGQA